MVVGCSYSSGANFTAGNDVEPGMFCGQAAARGATYRLVCGSEVTIYSVGLPLPNSPYHYIIFGGRTIMLHTLRVEAGLGGLSVLWARVT